MGILAMIVIPGNIDASNGELNFYGAATMVQKDAQVMKFSLKQFIIEL